MKLVPTAITLSALATLLLFLFPGSQPYPIVSPLASKPAPNSPAPMTPTPTLIPKPQVALPLVVPFTSQAPFAQWSDPRQQDACEEAAVLMTMKWATNKSIASKQAALDEILAIAAWQQENYGEYRDTSAADTLDRLIKNYYGYQNAVVKPISNTTDVISELESGNLVVTPMNGQALKNPFFTPPGPERHMVVIKGFDKATNEFITNDPGIRQGENYRYPMELFFAAIRDYETGYHIPITLPKKTMVVIMKR